MKSTSTNKIKSFTVFVQVQVSVSLYNVFTAHSTQDELTKKKIEQHNCKIKQQTTILKSWNI